MKLVELVEYLNNPQRLQVLYEGEGLNLESEAIIIYMHNSIALESDIIFFEIEETDDNLIFEKNGTIYYQLFPVDYAIELIENDLDLAGKGYSNLEIAQRLLNYRLKDA